MKKILLLLILLTLTANNTQEIKATSENIRVASELIPFWNNFVRIMSKNNIDVDYLKIESVDLVPMEDVQGYWVREARSVLINVYYPFPPAFMKVTENENYDMILLTLAHEVGHSQGWKHIDGGLMGFMNPTSRFDLQVVIGMGA